MRKEKKERKAKRKEKERKRGKRGKCFLERKGRKRRRRKGKRKIFPGFERSTFESSSTKVGARSGIYVWTPKSWSFFKLQEVGYFPTRFIFSLKAL